MLKLAFLVSAVTLAQAAPSGLESTLMHALKSALSPNAPKAISTTLADTGRQLSSLDDFSPENLQSLTWLPRAADGSFVLRPGAFSWTVLSYCLDVTAHGPSNDAAYLPATLGGPRAAVVGSILQAAAASPTMTQENVQMLVWSVTTNMGKAAQLLRDEFGAQASYHQQARVVETPVKTKKVAFPRSRWVYRAPGYFVRVRVQSYKITNVQVYVPEGWTLHRDASGRVSSVSAANGSVVALRYHGSGAVIGVKEIRGAADRGDVVAATSTIAYAGKDRDDATALHALENAIRHSAAGSPAWSTMRNRAADDVARTRAELVCRAVSCRAGASRSAAPKFALNTTMGVPGDGTLQPVALTTRGGDAGAGPLVPAAPPCDHTGSFDDPIPVECLPKAPPDPKADCPEVALQLAMEELGLKYFQDASIVARANGERDNGNQYAGLVSDAINDAIRQGALNAELNAAGITNLTTAQIGGSFPPGGSGASGSSSDAQTGALATTSMLSCTTLINIGPNDEPPIVYAAMLAHEQEHRKTCLARPPDKRNALDTPDARSADEQRGHAISIAMLKSWYNAHCKN